MKRKYKSRLSAALFSTAAFLFVFGLVHYNPRTKDKKNHMIHERNFEI